MSHFKNNPFTGDNPVEDLPVHEFIKLLKEFEAYKNRDDCLSVFLKSRYEQEEGLPQNHRWHIDCGSGASYSFDCNRCKISRTGKYTRNKFLNWVYGDAQYTKRGNMLTGVRKNENDK